MVKQWIRTSNDKVRQVSLVRSSAIKAFCTECLGWEADPKECTDVFCPLFPYRGKNLKAYGKKSGDREREEVRKEI